MARTENQNHVGPRAEDVAVKGRDPLSPQAQGLYDPAKEHDSCGVGFVANLHNAASPRHRRDGPADPAQSRSPRRRRRRSRSLATAAAFLSRFRTNFSTQEARNIGHRLADARRIRDRPVFSAARPRNPRQGARHRRSRVQDRGADGARLARSAGRFQRSRRRRARGRAFPRSGLRRTRRGRQGRGRFRAAPLSRAQDLVERDLRARGRGPRALLRFALVAHHRL